MLGTTFTVLMHFEKARQHTDRTYKIPADLSIRVLLVSENEQETEYVKRNDRKLWCESRYSNKRGICHKAYSQTKYQ